MKFWGVYNLARLYTSMATNDSGGLRLRIYRASGTLSGSRRHGKPPLTSTGLYPWTALDVHWTLDSQPSLQPLCTLQGDLTRHSDQGANLCYYDV